MEAMRLVRRAAPLAGLALVLSTAAARADVDNKVKLEGDETITAVSGYSGGYKDVGGDGDYQGLFGIEWWENADDPCKMTGFTHHLNTFDVKQPSTTIGACSSPGNRKYVNVAGNADNIYKIQVCTTDKSRTNKDKLKGIRVWGRSIEYSKPLKLTTQSTAQEVKHTNCKEWHDAVACPAGQIATRLRVHYNSEYDITGLALICRKVVNQ
jgi:hypothetical protein